MNEDNFRLLLPRLLPPIEKKSDGNIMSRCPLHDDCRGKKGRKPRPSLALHPEKGLKCFGCAASRDELMRALAGPGERRAPVAQKPSPAPVAAPQTPLGAPVAVYAYRDTEGRLVAQKARFETAGEKTFRFRRSEGQRWGGLNGLGIADLPLYGTELLATSNDDDPVWFVEGEKTADACRQRGLLTVTNAGGASQQDYGHALDALRGRIVRIWPDNDAAGQGWLATLQVALRGIARSVTVVQPPIPLGQKEDAYDYFAAGGTVAALEAGVLDRPAVRFLAHDAIEVRVPTQLGVVRFAFSEMEKTGREFSAELEVSIEGSWAEPYGLRLNLLSSSAQSDLRRSLESHFQGGKEQNWTGVVNTAVNRARKGFLSADVALPAEAIPDPGEQQFLVETILPDRAATLVFADGSSGKTFFALRLLAAVTLGSEFLGLQASSGPVVYVDYETDEFTWRRRLRRVLQGIGYDDVVPGLPAYYWPAHGISLIDQVGRLRSFVREKAVRLLIIDSAGAACGGRPEDAETALRYFSALARIDCASLTVAHVPKSQGSDDKPLGSVFFHNAPRRTWKIEATDDETLADKEVMLVCKKVNDGRRPAPMGVRVIFKDPDGPVTFTRFDLKDNQELHARRSAAQRIWDVLTRPMTPSEITEELGEPAEKRSIIAQTLRNDRGKRFVSLGDGRPGRGAEGLWSRLSPREEAL